MENSELALHFRLSNWCKIIESKADLGDDFSGELFSFKDGLTQDKPSCIKYTADIIESIDRVPRSEKQTATQLLIEYVDRGIHDWDQFSKKLSSDYPALKLLFVSQNFTYKKVPEIDNESPVSYYKRSELQAASDFLSFLQKAKLQIFAMYDSQSQFFESVDPRKIFDVQPENSCYSINIGEHDTLPTGTFYLENQHENKRLYFRVRNTYS